MKFIKFDDEYLEKFFDDNSIEDDNLYDFLKGTEPIDVGEQAESDVDEIINKNFEAVDGTLKMKIKVTITIEDIK